MRSYPDLRLSNFELRTSNSIDTNAITRRAVRDGTEEIAYDFFTTRRAEQGGRRRVACSLYLRLTSRAVFGRPWPVQIRPVAC